MGSGGDAREADELCGGDGSCGDDESRRSCGIFVCQLCVQPGWFQLVQRCAAIVEHAGCVYVDEYELVQRSGPD